MTIHAAYTALLPTGPAGWRNIAPTERCGMAEQGGWRWIFSKNPGLMTINRDAVCAGMVELCIGGTATFMTIPISGGMLLQFRLGQLDGS